MADERFVGFVLSYVALKLLLVGLFARALGGSLPPLLAVAAVAWVLLATTEFGTLYADGG